jgi:hypothetical protein
MSQEGRGAPTAVYVAQLKNKPELLLLAELGLLEGTTNLTFAADGTRASYPYPRFDVDSEREIPFDSSELSAPQRSAYEGYWKAKEQASTEEEEVNRLVTQAKRHPFRYDADRFGGRFLLDGDYRLDEVVTRLAEWLRRATDEDVIGDIGTYGGRTWLCSRVPDVHTGRPVPFDIHADSRAAGVADFLIFVRRCGGPDQLRMMRTGEKLVLVSARNADSLTSGGYFYWSQNW